MVHTHCLVYNITTDTHNIYVHILLLQSVNEIRFIIEKWALQRAGIFNQIYTPFQSQINNKSG